MRIESFTKTINFNNLKDEAYGNNLTAYCKRCSKKIIRNHTKPMPFDEQIKWAGDKYSYFDKIASLSRSAAKTAEALSKPLSGRANKIVEGSKVISFIGLAFLANDIKDDAGEFYNKPENIFDAGLSFIQQASDLADGLSMGCQATLAFKHISILETASGHLDNASLILGFVSIVSDIRNLYKITIGYKNTVKFQSLSTTSEINKAYSKAFKKRFLYQGLSITLSLVSTTVMYVSTIVFTYVNQPHVGWVLLAVSTSISLVRMGIEHNADLAFENEMKAIHQNVYAKDMQKLDALNVHPFLT